MAEDDVLLDEWRLEWRIPGRLDDAAARAVRAVRAALDDVVFRRLVRKALRRLQRRDPRLQAVRLRLAR
ncbi:MAG: hypothetical protein ACRDD1_11810 [Planctomycetia bacterium]